ncbi:hypothetical protein V6N13_055798 [Hibiscus sabdariffa]
MGHNFLVGEAPISIGNLQDLQGLNLGYNHLTGTVPSSIGNLPRLTKLDLSNNKFEGAIPSSLRNCKSLQSLDLSQNKLNGRIPHQLFGAFHGEIPMTLGECLELRTIFMQNNSFNGTIPQSFSSLKSLENLDLSDNNNLFGIIPPELQKLRFLVRLNLSFNQLEGEVPKHGVFQNASGFSFFGNKDICGGVQKLKLPKCFNEKSKKNGKVLSTKIITGMVISIVIGSVLVLLLVYLSLRRKARMGRLTAPALFDDGYLRLSYKELLECTQEYGMGGLVSPEGDIYSYGILLLEMITGRRPTNELFHDGFSLRNFCTMALQQGLEGMIDVCLVEEIDENRQRMRRRNMEEEIRECLVSFTKIGVSCSAEVAADRLRIKMPSLNSKQLKQGCLELDFIEETTCKQQKPVKCVSMQGLTGLL